MWQFNIGGKPTIKPKCLQNSYLQIDYNKHMIFLFYFIKMISYDILTIEENPKRDPFKRPINCESPSYRCSALPSAHRRICQKGWREKIIINWVQERLLNGNAELFFLFFSLIADTMPNNYLIFISISQESEPNHNSTKQCSKTETNTNGKPYSQTPTIVGRKTNNRQFQLRWEE